MLQMGWKRRLFTKSRHKTQYNFRFKGRNNSRVSSIIKTYIEVTQECVDAIKGHIQITGNEDCGILMGSIITENLIRVNKISDSLSKKQSSKTCCCELDRAKANAFITTDYERSNHTRVYIGEWHTHPEDFPSPSTVDVSSIKNSFKRNELPFKDCILMVIIGRKEIYWGLYNGSVLKKMTPRVV